MTLPLTRLYRKVFLFARSIAGISETKPSLRLETHAKRVYTDISDKGIPKLHRRVIIKRTKSSVESLRHCIHHTPIVNSYNSI